MDIKILLVILFFVILVSIQYTLNLIYKEIKEIRRYLGRDFEERWLERIQGK